MPRQSARVQEEAISEDLLASIPVVDKEAAVTTTFAIESEEVIAAPPPGGFEAGPAGAPPPGAPLGLALAQQLRYDLGEALARELDRASETFSTQIGDLERRLQQAESALLSAHQALEHERDSRELAEKRLAAFKELALK